MSNQGFSWKNRRRAAWANMTFSAAVISYILWNGEDTQVHEVAMTMAFWNLMGTIGSYVFGAAWENKK